MRLGDQVGEPPIRDIGFRIHDIIESISTLNREMESIISTYVKSLISEKQYIYILMLPLIQ